MASAPETISGEALQGRFLARCCPLVSKRCLGTKLPFLEPFFVRSGRAWDSPWRSGLCVCLLYKQGRRRMSSICRFLPLQPPKSPKILQTFLRKSAGRSQKDSLIHVAVTVSSIYLNFNPQHRWQNALVARVQAVWVLPELPAMQHKFWGRQLELFDFLWLLPMLPAMLWSICLRLHTDC